MKKLILVATVVAIAFTSCKKSDDDSTPKEKIPTTFTRKVLIEEFTGTWCGYCPDGAYKMEAIIDANPDKVFGASVHNGDPMELALFNSLDGVFNVSGFPTGMVERMPHGGTVPMDRGSWASEAASKLALTATCGLSVDSKITGTEISVDVKVAFNATLTGIHNLTVYLTEDNVNKGSSYNQHNYYDATTGSPFFGLGDPIPGFKHNNVIVAVLTADMGDPITTASMVPGGVFKQTLTGSISNFNKDNLYVVAFVNRIGATATTHEILNVQRSKAGVKKNWD